MKLFRTLTHGTMSLLTVAVCVSSCFGQFGSGIQGTVQDPSGGFVANATVSLLNTETQVSSKTKTNDSGSYRFISLAPGAYTITVEAAGFSKTAVNIKLETGQTLDLPVAVAVSGTSAQLVVTGEAPVLNTAETRNQLTLETQALAQLPMAGRSMISLVTTAPGAVGRGVTAGGSPGSGVDNFSTETQVDVSANGVGSVGNMYVIDGLDISSAIRPGVLNMTPNPDSIQETSIQTNTFSVEYGRASSIQMLMTTKSGTEGFHGNIADYFTDQKLAAGTIFVHKYAPYHSNNVSATVGGPIVPKKQFFFFFSYEPLRASSATGNGIVTYEDAAFTNWAKQNFPNTLGTKLLTSYGPTGAVTTGVAKTAADLFPGTCGTSATNLLPCSTPMVDSTNITSTQETRQASTSVGSLGGDVLGTAGGQYLQLSSDITAPQGDVNIAAQNITLQSNNNTRSVLNIVRERQSGLTLRADNPLISAAQTVVEMAKVAKRTENGRYQAMALLTSGMTIYNQYHALTDTSNKQVDPKADAAPSSWSFSATIGGSQSNYESLTNSTTPIESSINAGRNVSLTATGGADRGDINLIGSRVIASENLTLRADRDITMTAAVGRDTETTKRTSSAASVGISVGFGGSGAGVSLTLAASRSNAWSNGWGTTFWNSELTAGKLLSVDSGRDWALSGAKATGETVLARIGSKGAGNLTLVSPQDESFYQAKEQSFGFNASIPIYGGGSAPPSLGLSASGLKLLAENESIKQQSSIVSGIGGYDVRVNGHTHLKGSAIASKGDPVRNYFATQTLTHEDVQNRDVVSGKSWSVSVTVTGASPLKADGTAYFPDAKPGLGGSAVGFARLDTNETFTTKSSIASPVNLTRPDLQAGKVAAMKAAERDPLAAARDQKQAQLNELLWNEPPNCDGCNYNSLPTTPVSAVAGAKVSNSGINQTEKVSTPPIEGTDSNSQWIAWQRAVQALQGEINGLNTRISAVDAKVYQTTLTTSPSGLHQPLLHTFDKGKATQELKDGVAVTAEFGRSSRARA